MMTFYRYFLVLLSVLAFFSCKWESKRGSAVATTDTGKVRKKQEGPDIKMLRQRLFTFFEKHKAQDEFDTTDYTYVNYGGIVNFPPNAVRAGHLFNDRQVHAMIFYSDDSGAGLIIYLKEKEGWKKIFEDTAIDGQPGSAFPMFTDWNRDGEKDITIQHKTPAYLNSNYDLWLVDRSGSKLYAIDSFSNIPNPEIDNATNHVISYSTCGCADNCMLLGEYTFKDYTLQQLYEIDVACCGVNSSKDSECQITFTRNNKESPPVYSRTENVYKHVPKTWQEMMRGKYSKN